MKRPARAVMVLGCTSGAGKSWLATALCRWYARQGLKVAPFKAQNMSNHARVVPAAAGRPAGEIGSAQYFQALAARAEPDVRMNPVLLKPEADTRSQVVLMGQVRPELTTMPWRERSQHLWPAALAALQSLREEVDVLVIEGAGSPAEINLATSDYVNTRTARAAEAACLLVADIDRGGAFAHLYGTHALMDAQVARQLRGFVLNRFRGDATLLAPAPAQLQQLTGVPTVAVVPMQHDHGLPEEDAVPAAHAAATGPRVVVLATPHASNLDEFEPLRQAGVAVSFSRDAETLRAADWLVLPGSKHTRADAQWLQAQGLAALVQAHAASGRPLLAVCGGLQVLGEQLHDPQGLEGGQPGSTAGLGVLPLATRFQPAKQLQRRGYRFGLLQGVWAPLSQLSFEGYEIHLGDSQLLPRPGGMPPQPALAGSPGLGWQHGSVLALYLHGLLENPAVLQALFGRRPRPLDAVFDGLADTVDAAFQPGVLRSLLDPPNFTPSPDTA
ncbi:cobyric acid synthase [Aquincola tertiaricarbonis]|uniref:cobyric acid synthase n=1 Tax=Aquincola tertiaricarbonis TaxID=391953 RepID=UPI000614ABC3|nr:cobyric acid synthase [Aquincola tertiaricarbonis]